MFKRPVVSSDPDENNKMLVVQVWIENRGFGETQSEIKKRVREGLQKADISAPVPVAAPAVAPWAPAEDKPEHDGERPDRKPN